MLRASPRAAGSAGQSRACGCRSASVSAIVSVSQSTTSRPSASKRSAGTVRAAPNSASIAGNAGVYIRACRSFTGRPKRANISQPRSDQLE
jgi:hypothetical protein